MSLDPLERARRLTPLAVAAFSLAVLLVPGAVAAGAAPPMRAILAPGLLALAAALATHAIASARPGWSGVVGGAVAGVWLAACPPVRALAAAVSVPTLALACTAGLLTAGERLARAGDRPRDRGLVAAALATALVIAELRGFPLALVTAVLLARRADARARWLALGPWLAGITGAVLVVLGLIGLAPAWAAPPTSTMAPAAWLADAVDRLGPLTLVAVALGLATLVGERRDRWLAGLAVATLASLVPLTSPLAPPAMIALALALGVAVSELATRVGRPAHQVLAGATVTVLLAAPFALT